MKTKRFSMFNMKENRNGISHHDWQPATLQSGGITFKPRIKRRQKFCGVLTGLVAALCIFIALSYIGLLSSRAPSLPEVLDGDIVIGDSVGHREAYNIHFNYEDEIIQLNYLYSQDTPSRHRREIAEGFTELNASKVVIEDFKNKIRYLIIPSEGNSSMKCWKAELDGTMLPRDILKNLKAGQVPEEIKERYLQKYNFLDGMEVNVTTSKSNTAKIDKVIIRSKNISMTLRPGSNRSWEQIDVTKLKCFFYDELTGVVDEKFEESDQVNYALNRIDSRISNFTRRMDATLRQLEILQKSNNKTIRTPSRRRRGIDWNYGTWCGPKNGGYENHCARGGQCKAPYDKVDPVCRACTPPIDGLDSDCMEHDRCLKEAGKGPKGCVPQGNRCSCDFQLAVKALGRVGECVRLQRHACSWSAIQIGFTFTNLLSCWFPTRVCFPTIKTVCRCSKCSCPLLQTGYTCIMIKLCVPFGSGKVFL